jgi:negative regulator of sigma E activity
LQLFPPRQVPEQTRADLPAPPPMLPAWIRRNFNVSAESGEQIAGRETWRIRLQPKNNSAASYVFWLDQRWLLRLAAEERDSSGEVVYSARFVRLGTPNPRQQARQLNLLEPKPKLQSFVQSQTGLQLPDGFEVVEIRPRTVSKDNLPALEVHASNGIGVLLYVFAPIGTANTPRIVSRKLQARTFVWVVGNLSRAELERTASSVGAGLNLDSLLLSFQGLR